MQRLERAGTHTIVSAESMATSSALQPSPPSRLLPLLTGKGTVAEIVIERSGPQQKGGCGVIRQSPHYTHTPYSRFQKGSPIDNIQCSGIGASDLRRHR